MTLLNVYSISILSDVKQISIEADTIDSLTDRRIENQTDKDNWARRAEGCAGDLRAVANQIRLGNK